MFVCLFVCLFACLFVCLFVCLFACLLVCLLACLFVCWLVYLFYLLCFFGFLSVKPHPYNILARSCPRYIRVALFQFISAHANPEISVLSMASARVDTADPYDMLLNNELSKAHTILAGDHVDRRSNPPWEHRVAAKLVG